MFEDVWIVNVDNWKLSIYFSSSSFHSFVERICRIGDFPLPKFDCKEQLKTQIFAGSGHRFMESSQAGTLGYTINYYGYIYNIYIHMYIIYICIVCVYCPFPHTLNISWDPESWIDPSKVCFPAPAKVIRGYVIFIYSLHVYTRQHNSLIFGNIHVGLLPILDHLHPLFMLIYIYINILL